MQKEAKAITVLCVDDEQQTALRSVLESEGYKVLFAASGSEGLETFKSEAVNAVILDYWMMDMSGLKVAQQIRQLSRSVPIIMLSSYIELLDESLGLVDVWIRKGERSSSNRLFFAGGEIIPDSGARQDGRSEAGERSRRSQSKSVALVENVFSRQINRKATAQLAPGK